MAGLRNVLQIRQAQTQTLTMTPQLQQAIRLLQLSTLELRREIQQTMDSNPLLEIDESTANSNMESLEALADQERSSADNDTFDPFSNDNQGSDIQFDNGLSQSGDNLSVSNMLNTDNDPHDIRDAVSFDEGQISDFDHAADTLSEAVPMAEGIQDPGIGSTETHPDSIMREDNYSAGSRSRNQISDEDSVYEGETEQSLKDHLLWQLDCSPLQGRDRLIAEAVIDAVDDSGYLSEDLENILAIVQKEWPDTTIRDVEIVLKLVQHYDPLGVAARNVQECLLIQLNEKAKTDDSNELKLAQFVVGNLLHLLSNHDYRTLCSRLAIKEDMLKRINDIIVSLNPRPGNGAVQTRTDFVIPDVLVYKNADGEYDVMLNPDALPKIRLNEQYRTLAGHARDEREKEFFKSNLQEANWFIQSIAKRNDTLLKVSKCIVEHQKAFLDHGEHRMEPLVLNDIATEIDMHESTISRVTTEKYLYTPRGTYELKYFFSSHVSTESGGHASSTAIRAEIKTLVASENPRRPFSDNQIANLLKEKGFCVARRTIAKYREALGIGSSSQRKRLI